VSESPESFFAGLLLFGLLAGAVAFTGARARAVLLPGWLGAPGLLISAIISLSVLLVEASLLGALGLLDSWTVVALAVAVAFLVWLRPRPPLGPPTGPPARVALGFGAGLAATAFAALTVAQWGSFGSLSLDFGVTNFDSVWYHLPFSAEFARVGTIFTDFRPETVFLNWFYPFNSELFHAVGMSVTGRDFLSLFVNYGWLALGLLAAWVAGRPWGRPHLSLGLASVVFAAHMLVVREPGTAKNDIMAISLVLAAVAVLISSAGNGSGRGRVATGPPLVVVGLALGMAAGTKVTVLPLAVFVGLAGVLASPAGTRLRASASILAAGLVTGGLWYARNLFQTGNPLPQVRDLGPLSLPGPDHLQEARPDFDVFHYLFDGAAWTDYLAPGLDRALGPLWPLLLVVFLIGTVAVVWRGPGATVRALGLAALGGALAYLFTPLGAAGPEGEPTAFVINLRFLAPALVTGLVLIPALAAFERPWPRRLLLLGIALLFLTGTRIDAVTELSGRYFGIVLAALTVVLPALAWSKRETIRHLLGGRPPGRILVPASLVAAFLLAWPLADHYFDSRYRDFEPELGMAPAYRWANGTGDDRVALAGTTAGFRGYGFFGPRLSNEVRYVGRPAPSGGFDVIRSCPAFRREVNRIAPDFLVTSPFLDFNRPDRPGPANERAWVMGSPALSEVAGGGAVTVWRVDGRLDPSACEPGLPGPDSTPGLVDP
jgi:hypothetical protein